LIGSDVTGQAHRAGGATDASEARIMIRNHMAIGMQSHETALSGTVAAWLATRSITVRRARAAATEFSDVPAAPDTGSAKQAAPSPGPKRSSAAGKKWRRRRPVRMTAKAQRRRWFRQHNKRMRAQALKIRDKGNHAETNQNATSEAGA
jgi:hypothetical protein